MYKKTKKIAEAGFTLVELSIVIVIVGFLVAGIAAGSNMVKQAQLRSVISDLQSFQTAYNGFIGRFNNAPGDMSTAYSFWTGATNCAVTATAANCNGDGDGVIEVGTTSALDEVAKSWKHLQLAGYIGSGIAQVPNALVALAPGTNAPASKITGAAYFLAGTTNLSRQATAVNIGVGAGSTNYLYLGRAAATPLNLISGSLRPEDAFNVDSKLDDGTMNGTNFIGFNTGKIRSVLGNGNAANSCVNAGNTSYVVTTTTTSCLVGMAVN